MPNGILKLRLGFTFLTAETRNLLAEQCYTVTESQTKTKKEVILGGGDDNNCNNNLFPRSLWAMGESYIRLRVK